MPTIHAAHSPRECVQILLTFCSIWQRHIPFNRWICFAYHISPFSLPAWEIFIDSNKISLFWVIVFAISSEMFNVPIICDKANRGFGPDSSLLPYSKPFSIRSFVTELIEFTCSATLGLSFRIRGHTSMFPFPNNAPI